MVDQESGEQLESESLHAEQDAAFAAAVKHTFRRLVRLRLRRNLHERRRRRAFERTLYARHRYALDRFDHFLAACNDLSDSVDRLRSPEAELDNDSVFFALSRIQARACLIASEVRTLVFSGHASGALARWRTLHELAVISTFVKRHGPDAAERYMWSEVVKTAKEARRFNNHCGHLGLEPLDEDEINSLEQQSEHVLRRFGKELKEDWGWASPFLLNTPAKPTFVQIEESVDMQQWQVHVGMANLAVHGGFKGMLTDIGTGSHRYSDLKLAGPSMRGLIIPVDATMQEFLSCTLTFLLHRPGPDSHLRAGALTRYLDDARQAFLSLERSRTEEPASLSMQSEEE